MLTRLRPRRFASYSAASARAYQSALLSPACQPATPIDSVIRSMASGWPPTRATRLSRLTLARTSPTMRKTLVPDVVPVGVVDALEVIDIGHDEMRG
jgi:hypothetical protein